MNMDELVTLAFTRLPVVNSSDRDSVERAIRHDLHCGISIDDAIKIAYYTEEVSPHFTEEYALAKMHDIYAKYPNRQKCEPCVNVVEDHVVHEIDTRRLYE